MTTRREFLKTCACAGAIGALQWMGAGCGGDGDGGPAAPDPSGTHTIDLNDFPALASDNSGVVVGGTPAGSIFVTHTTGDSYFALSRRCTHQGNTVNPPAGGSQQMVCPAHGSRYSLTGSVLQGPATNPLESWPVTVDGTTLTINFD